MLELRDFTLQLNETTTMPKTSLKLEGPVVGLVVTETGTEASAFLAALAGKKEFSGQAFLDEVEVGSKEYTGTALLVPQEIHGNPDQTVSEFLREFAKENKITNKWQSRANVLLRRLHLGDAEGWRFKEMDHAQQVCIYCVACLMSGAPWFLLDEVLQNMPPVIRAEMIRLFWGLQQTDKNFLISASSLNDALDAVGAGGTNLSSKNFGGLSAFQSYDERNSADDQGFWTHLFTFVNGQLVIQTPESLKAQNKMFKVAIAEALGIISPTGNANAVENLIAVSKAEMAAQEKEQSPFHNDIYYTGEMEPVMPPAEQNQNYSQVEVFQGLNRDDGQRDTSFSQFEADRTDSFAGPAQELNDANFQQVPLFDIQDLQPGVTMDPSAGPHDDQAATFVYSQFQNAIHDPEPMAVGDNVMSTPFADFTRNLQMAMYSMQGAGMASMPSGTSSGAAAMSAAPGAPSAVGSMSTYGDAYAAQAPAQAYESVYEDPAVSYLFQFSTGAGQAGGQEDNYANANNATPGASYAGADNGMDQARVSARQSRGSLGLTDEERMQLGLPPLAQSITFELGDGAYDPFAYQKIGSSYMEVTQEDMLNYTPGTFQEVYHQNARSSKDMTNVPGAGSGAYDNPRGSAGASGPEKEYKTTSWADRMAQFQSEGSVGSADSYDTPSASASKEKKEKKGGGLFARFGKKNKAGAEPQEPAPKAANTPSPSSTSPSPMVSGPQSVGGFGGMNTRPSMGSVGSSPFRTQANFSSAGSMGASMGGSFSSQAMPGQTMGGIPGQMPNQTSGAYHGQLPGQTNLGTAPTMGTSPFATSPASPFAGPAPTPAPAMAPTAASAVAPTVAPAVVPSPAGMNPSPMASGPDPATMAFAPTTDPGSPAGNFFQQAGAPAANTFAAGGMEAPGQSPNLSPFANSASNNMNNQGSFFQNPPTSASPAASSPFQTPSPDGTSAFGMPGGSPFAGQGPAGQADSESPFSGSPFQSNAPSQGSFFQGQGGSKQGPPPGAMGPGLISENDYFKDVTNPFAKSTNTGTISKEPGPAGHKESEIKTTTTGWFMGEDANSAASEHKNEFVPETILSSKDDFLPTNNEPASPSPFPDPTGALAGATNDLKFGTDSGDISSMTFDDVKGSNTGLFKTQVEARDSNFADFFQNTPKPDAAAITGSFSASRIDLDQGAESELHLGDDNKKNPFQQ